MLDSTCRVRIDVGLSAPNLFVVGLRGVDKVSGLFRFDVDVVADRADVAAADEVDLGELVGKPCHITFESGFLEDLVGDAQKVHGCVTRVEQGDREERFTSYRITVMPRVTRLAHRSACRIFQETDAQAIAKIILGEHGFSGSDFDFRFSESLIARPYCVQYRETDWDFLCRILGDEGVFSFFKHDGQKEVLVFGNEHAVHPNLQGEAKLPYRRRESASPTEECVTAFIPVEALVSGAVSLREWNFEQPDLDGDGHFEVKKESESGSPTALEVYEYPGQYTAASPDGGTRARLRLEQLQTGKRNARGESTSPRMAAGHVFELDGHYRADLNDKYLLLEVYHRVSSGAGDAGHDGTIHAYRAEFVAQLRDTPFRPSLRVAKPRIQGVQTALVVGPKGEEVHTDDRGRVLLKFHWDRAPDREAPTAWVRVAQFWGSNEYGAFFLPRIKQEVVVAFEDGDPDRPLVVGTIFFGPPPIALPANKTQSTIKSRSTPHGSGANEIRFEDKKDSEELYLHAEKDLSVEVENDATHSIGNDESRSVEHDRKTDIGHDESIEVGGNYQGSIGGNSSHTIGGTQDLSVSKASSVRLGDTSSLEVAKGTTVKVGGALQADVSKTMELKVADATTVTITKALKLKAKTIAIEAEDELTIKVGDVSISLKKNGDFSVKAGKVTVAASKDAKLTSDKSIVLKAGKDFKAEASANVVLKGSKIAGN